MNEAESIGKKVGMEVDFKALLEKIFQYKFLFLASILLCLIIGFVYIKLAIPLYEVGTSLLIDPTGKSRQLGESRYVDGGVGLIEAEKNIFNEIGILKSYGLIKGTVKQLGFDVSYYAKSRYRQTEKYKYFPFQVVPNDDETQIYDIPFQVEILTDTSYRLSTIVTDFEVSNPATGTTYEVKKKLAVSEIYSFGKPVNHNYFHFTINKPQYEVDLEVFEEEDLLFIIHQVESVTSNYLGKLEVNQLDIQASILELRSVGPVVEKEIDFLSQLSQNYIEGQLSERDRIALRKQNFIRKQLASISDSLAQAQNNLEAFRRNSQSVDLSQSASIALNQVQNLKSRQSQIELNIKYYESQLSNLQDSASVDNIIAPSVAGIDDPLLNENLLELKRLYSERNRLSFIKGSESLDLVLVSEQIQNSTNSVKGNLSNMIQSSGLALDEVNSQIGNQEGIINRLPGNEKKLLNFQRTGALYENLYNYLSQELAKTGIAKAEDTPDTKVLDEARRLGSKPISPQKSLILAFAFIVGLALPLAWIILYNSIDDTIQSEQELKAHTNIPIAASIATDHAKPSLSFSQFVEWRVEESFRDLTAGIQFLVADPDKNIIGVTSTIPGEGKSYCSLNMGMHFARSGKKILLIDADFRKPSHLETMDYQEQKSFASFLLNEEVDVESVIHQHPSISNFHFIPANMEEINPHTLLSSPRFLELLKRFKNQYDYIIIDSPAIGLVSDYLLISEYIDINLFVLRRKISKLSFLKNLDKLKREGKLKDSYIIFNGVIGRSFKYGYYRYGYAENSKGKDRFGLKAIKDRLF